MYLRPCARQRGCARGAARRASRTSFSRERKVRATCSPCLFSRAALAEIVKAVVKFIVIGTIAAWLLAAAVAEALATRRLDRLEAVALELERHGGPAGRGQRDRRFDGEPTCYATHAMSISRRLS